MLFGRAGEPGGARRAQREAGILLRPSWYEPDLPLRPRGPARRWWEGGSAWVRGGCGHRGGDARGGRRTWSDPHQPADATARCGSIETKCRTRSIHLAIRARRRTSACASFRRPFGRVARRNAPPPVRVRSGRCERVTITVTGSARLGWGRTARPGDGGRLGHEVKVSYRPVPPLWRGHHVDGRLRRLALRAGRRTWLRGDHQDLLDGEADAASVADGARRPWPGNEGSSDAAEISGRPAAS